MPSNHTVLSGPPWIILLALNFKKKQGKILLSLHWKNSNWLYLYLKIMVKTITTVDVEETVFSGIQYNEFIINMRYCMEYQKHAYVYIKCTPP